MCIRDSIGVDRPSNGMAIVDYVLQKFSKTERVIMDKVIDHSARAVEAFIETSRFDNVMNEYNGEIK